MMILITWGMLYWASCFSQNDTQADSLIRVLKMQTDETGKVNTLNNLSRRFLIQGKDTLSLTYATQAIALATKLGYKKGCIFGHTYMGLNYERMGKYAEAMKELQAALFFAQQEGDKKNLSMANNNIGLVYGDQGDPQEAIRYYRIAANLSGEIGDKKNQANAYYNIGNTYYSPISNFTEAIRAHTISLQLSSEVGDRSRVSSRHIDIGNSYESLGNYPKAIENYLASLSIAEALGEKGNIASAYNNIGEIYNNLGDFKEALKNYHAGLKIFKEIESQYGIAISYDNIGEVFQKQGRHEDAMKYHLLAFNMYTEMNYSYGKAYSYRNIGNSFSLQGKYEEALIKYLASLDIFKEIQDNEGIAKLYKNIGQTYFKLSKYEEARKFLNDALQFSKKIGGKDIIMDTYEEMAKLDSASGNWQSAFSNQKLFSFYKDSLLNEENKKKITESSMQYEFDKKEINFRYKQTISAERLKQQTLIARQQEQALLLKEQELALISNEKQLQLLQMQKDSVQIAAHKTQVARKEDELALLGNEKAIQSLQLKKQKLIKNYILAGLGVFLILIFFVYRNYQTRQQLKLQLLRNKIANDLHDDVGSTLSSISIFSQMAQEGTKDQMPLLEIIGESSRKMLDAMADIVWTINPENDQFEKIVMRMKNFAYDLLGAKNIDFEFLAGEEISRLRLSMEVRKNLYLIFKEATNNMVKYAGANKAVFSIKGEKNQLTMLIRDNGQGFDIDRIILGNGLKNMKKRAAEMRAYFNIETSPGNGTTIRLQLAV